MPWHKYAHDLPQHVMPTCRKKISKGTFRFYVLDFWASIRALGFGQNKRWQTIPRNKLCFIYIYCVYVYIYIYVSYMSIQNYMSFDSFDICHVALMPGVFEFEKWVQDLSLTAKWSWIRDESTCTLHATLLLLWQFLPSASCAGTLIFLLVLMSWNNWQT